jgi:hypothetical protein
MFHVKHRAVQRDRSDANSALQENDGAAAESHASAQILATNDAAAQ